jgi:hypothetical protein
MNILYDQRPRRRRSAEQRDELARRRHSIASSAWERDDNPERFFVLFT